VSRDGGWDRPWHTSIGLYTNGRRPLFRVKIACLKATVHTVTHPSLYKPVLQILLYDSASILSGLWHIRQSPLAYHAVTAAVRQSSHNHCANSQNSLSCFCVNCQKPVVHFPRLWKFPQWLCSKVGRFLIKTLFWMKVPLESIDFYVKIPKTSEQNCWGHCWLAERYRPFWQCT
jgi:hypothetical protein